MLKIVVKRLQIAEAAQALNHWKFLLQDLEKQSRIPRGTLAWDEFVERRRVREKRVVMKELERTREALEQSQAAADMYFFQVGEHSGTKYLPYWDMEVSKHIPICLVIGSLRAVRAVADLFWALVDRWGELARGQVGCVSCDVYVSMMCIYDVCAYIYMLARVEIGFVAWLPSCFW